MKRMKRLLTLALSLLMLLSSQLPAMAASIADAKIDPARTGSLTVYAYDMTNAAKDGVWSSDSYVSTGKYDLNVNAALGNPVRKGDSDNISDLGSGGTSTGYAIAGAEYRYLKIADVYQHSQSGSVELLYGFPKAEKFLGIIGLADGKNAHSASTADIWYYASDVLNKALAETLHSERTGIKSALEDLVIRSGTAMPLTDGSGKTAAGNLPLGLYLVCLTKVPEMVTCTADPALIALPMTTTDGQGWMYDVTVYPKNQTGIVTLEKTVRESTADTGKNNGTGAITDGYAHNATGSFGDMMEYQIISTLPTITSAATALSEYTYQDALDKGLTYCSQPKIQWYADRDCTQLISTWDTDSGYFTAEQKDMPDGSQTMAIKMTESGLAIINSEAGNKNGALYRGYSNYTMRITYTAQINNNAVLGNDGNNNRVVLTWRRTSMNYYDTLVDDCHVYSYGLDLTKYFSDGKTDQALYNQVEFKIHNDTDACYIQADLLDGVWYVTGHTENESDATVLHPVSKDAQPGRVVIRGLEDDTYTITEIRTAAGYQLLSKPIRLKISSTDDPTRPCSIYSQDTLGVIQNDSRYSFDGGLDLRLANIPQKALAHHHLTAAAAVDGTPTDMGVDGGSLHALAKMAVTNTQGFEIPKTGDSLGLMIPILSAILILCAGVILFIGRKKHQS